MSWSTWYSIRSYLRSSLWIVPFVAAILEQVLLRITLFIDGTTNWSPPWPFGPVVTTVALQTIISLMLSFIVFTFGSMLVAIQVASGQLTPRIIATTLLRDNTIRFVVGLFVVTLLAAFGAMNRVGETPPHLTTWVATILGALSLAGFLFLIDYAARMLRPVSVVSSIAREGINVIRSVFPEPLPRDGEADHATPDLVQVEREVNKPGASEIIIAINTQALIRLAESHKGLIEINGRIGDFIASGQALFKLRGGAGNIADGHLIGLVAFGGERTLEQDSAFAFRVIVDIGIKALSQAINDPTTAVLAIDQLQRLLRSVGERNLKDDFLRDSKGTPRVILRTPNWEDFVQLTCREIRLYGAGNFQIARRMLAMLDNLIGTLPAVRSPPLVAERELLIRMIDKLYLLPEDAAIARIPDTQGLGGTG
jgi:uncharacterized membrane protein